MQSLQSIFIARVLLGLSCFLISTQESSAQLLSSIPGVSVGNAHVISLKRDFGSPKIVRGKTPSAKGLQELIDFGVTDFLIFKNERRGEVQAEKRFLNTHLGVPLSRIKTIPFKWKNYENFYTPCAQTLEALTEIYKISYLRENRKIFFHCTAGEDRTGYLAGLIRQLFDGWNASEAFNREMCARGYSAGNPRKRSPRNFQSVVLPIRRELTPLYQKMSYKIEMGYLTLRDLYWLNSRDQRVNRRQIVQRICGVDPKGDFRFRNSIFGKTENFICSY